MKVVLVKSPDKRNFKVSFSSNEGQSDFLAFKNVFNKICLGDSYLNSIASHYCSFQKYDSTFGCNIELTEFEEINSGDTIELVVSTAALMDVHVESLEPTEESNSYCSDELDLSVESVASGSSGSAVTQPYGNSPSPINAVRSTKAYKVSSL